MTPDGFFGSLLREYRMHLIDFHNLLREYRMHLGNESEKLRFSLCIALDFHYICSRYDTEGVQTEFSHLNE